MLVRNKTVRLICLGNKVTLIPGMNDLSKLKAHQIKGAMPIFKELEERGDIELPKLDVDDDFSEGVLGPLNAGDAVKVVRDTFDYDKLLELQKEEQEGKARATVLKALENQIKVSEDALNEGDEE